MSKFLNILLIFMPFNHFQRINRETFPRPKTIRNLKKSLQSPNIKLNITSKISSKKNRRKSRRIPKTAQQFRQYHNKNRNETETKTSFLTKKSKVFARKHSITHPIFCSLSCLAVVLFSLMGNQFILRLAQTFYILFQFSLQFFALANFPCFFLLFLFYCSFCSFCKFFFLLAILCNFLFPYNQFHGVLISSTCCCKFIHKNQRQARVWPTRFFYIKICYKFFLKQFG